ARTAAMLASSRGLSSTSAIRLAVSSASASVKPRVVMAGVPSRIPLATKGFSGSLGMAFLLTVMCAGLRTASASLPVMPLGRRSTSITWLSVRPGTMRSPRLTSVSASTLAFLTTCWAYCLNSGDRASWKATALAAMTCISGPPWIPGKMAELMIFSYSDCIMMTPPRGPRSDFGMGHRVGVGAARHQARVVRDVYHQQRAVVVRDARQAFKIDMQRVRRRARHDELGLVFPGQLLDLGVVQHFVGVQAVRNEVVQFAGCVDRGAVGQVAAFGEAHAQHGIARL